MPQKEIQDLEKEQTQEKEKKQENRKCFAKLKAFAATIWPYLRLYLISQAGVILTSQMTKNLKISNVLSSSVQGLIFAVFFEKDFDCHYSATFSGMSAIAVFHDNIGYASFTALIHTTIFLICRKVFLGFGGKLGTMSMVSCLLGAFLPYLVEDGYTYPIHNKELYELEDFEENYYLNPIFCFIGSVSTFVIRKYVAKVQSNVVISSALVGIVACFVFPMVIEQKTAKLQAIVFTGTFVGMSADKILGEKFHMYGLAGIVAGFALQGLNGTFLVGGKYGFSSFIGVNSCFYGRRFALFLLEKINQKNQSNNKVSSEEFQQTKEQQNHSTEHDIQNQIKQMKPKPISSENGIQEEDSDNGNQDNSCIDPIESSQKQKYLEKNAQNNADIENNYGNQEDYQFQEQNKLEFNLDGRYSDIISNLQSQSQSPLKSRIPKSKGQLE